MVTTAKGSTKAVEQIIKQTLENGGNTLVVDGKSSISAPHQNHIDNPNQYDRDGKFIVGSGEICPSCGTEWEDHFAIAVCPCLDR